MNTPHKHAALIKAWADGAHIQARLPGGEEWQDVEPKWNSRVEYRLKPDVLRHRRYIYKNPYGVLMVFTYNEQCERGITNVESQLGFIRWIDNDWITVEA